jgi:hypothetical protein
MLQWISHNMPPFQLSGSGVGNFFLLRLEGGSRRLDFLMTNATEQRVSHPAAAAVGVRKPGQNRGLGNFAKIDSSISSPDVRNG